MKEYINGLNSGLNHFSELSFTSSNLENNDDITDQQILTNFIFLNTH